MPIGALFLPENYVCFKTQPFKAAYYFWRTGFLCGFLATPGLMIEDLLWVCWKKPVIPIVQVTEIDSCAIAGFADVLLNSDLFAVLDNRSGYYQRLLTPVGFVLR